MKKIPLMKIEKNCSCSLVVLWICFYKPILYYMRKILFDVLGTGWTNNWKDCIFLPVTLFFIVFAFAKLASIAAGINNNIHHVDF